MDSFPIRILTLLLLVTHYLPLTALAQETHLVYVGVNGSFFSPSTISAGVNDTVSFQFGADVHSVHQSTFENPCTPLDGGFSSGLAGLKGEGFSAKGDHPTPVWNLTISNATAPIYFMCDSIDPVYHCTAGMVGIINTPNAENFTAFAAAARQTNIAPTVTPTIALLGQGAFATLAPTAPPAPSSTATETSPAATVAADATTSSATSSSGPPAGAIAGGIVAGIILLALLVWLVVKQNRKKVRAMTDRFSFARPDAPTLAIQIPSSPPSTMGLGRTRTKDTYYSTTDVEKQPETPSDRFIRKHSLSESIHSVHSTHRRNSLHRTNSRSSARRMSRASVRAMDWEAEPVPVPHVPTTLMIPPRSPMLDPLSPSPAQEEFELGTATRAVSMHAASFPAPANYPPFPSLPPSPQGPPPSPGSKRSNGSLRPVLPPIKPPPVTERIASTLPTPSPAYSFSDPFPKNESAPPVPDLPAFPRDVYAEAPMRRTQSRRRQRELEREVEEHEDRAQFARKLGMMGDAGVTKRDSDGVDGLPEYGSPPA